MLFSSIVFIFYFLPLSLAGNAVLSFSRGLQNIWLLLVSLIFYAWGEPLIVFLMLLSITVNWLLGFAAESARACHSHRSAFRRKSFLFTTCVFNLGFLFVFKYLGFVVRNVNAAAGADLIRFGGLSLPIGISFYTFQAMSYVFDVYRGEAKIEKNPLNVGLYIAFFPQLVAGPIVRFSDIAEQIGKRRVTFDMFSSGICRFVAGLGKKILIANSMALMADHVFNLSAMSDAYANVPVTLAWLGSVAYTLQIYYDFSGYSDMAIGLGWMFGFRFQENFNYPYVSDSVGEFWRRWHISLTTWFREYVYFPLGGSRISNMDTVAWNSFVVWVLTGMWHGAEWTFLLWGLWNFFFSSLERVTNFARRGIPPLMKHVYLLLVVNIGWVFFRASDLYQAFLFLRNMFGMNDNGFFSATATMFVREYWIFLALGILFSAPVMPRIGKALRDGGLGLYGRLVCAVYPFAVLGLFAVCVAWLVKGSYNPFIYFNF